MSAQLDSIYLVYGFAFLALGTLVWNLQQRPGQVLPWRYLAWFGLLHGASEWLDMVAMGLGDSVAFKVLRLVFVAASFLALAEFGRRGLETQGRRVPKVWIVASLLVLAAMGGVAGIAGLNAACRYALGFPGGLLAAWAFWRQGGRSAPSQSWPLRVTGCAVLVYTIAAGLVVPKGSFFPASVLNYDRFLLLTGFPVQLIRSLCAAAAAVCVWVIYRKSGAEADDAPWSRRWVIPVLVAGLLAGGVLGAQHLGYKADLRQRASLLASATDIADTIDVDRVKKLSFTSTDKDNPEFQRLRAQLRAYARTAGLRVVYVNALRGGKTVFGPETLEENDPILRNSGRSSTPPGTEYTDPPAELGQVFRTGRGRSVGPYTDEYQTFVSAFVPLLDRRSGECLATLGVDIEAQTWEAVIVRARMVPLLFVAALLCIVLLGFACLERRQYLARGHQRHTRHFESVLAAATGLALTIGATWLAYDAGKQSRCDYFFALARAQASDFGESLRSQRDRLADLARYFGSESQVSLEQFRAFARPLAGSGLTEAYGWAPAVQASNVQWVDHEARRQGLAGFMIWERDSQGKRIPATGRGIYYPVLYSEPPNDQVSGYDLGTEPIRRAALEEAARTGLVTVTDPIALARVKSAEKGLLVFHPVFAKDTPHGLAGYAVAVLPLQSILRWAIIQPVEEQSGIANDLFQLDAGDKPRFLASSSDEETRRHKRGKAFAHLGVDTLVGYIPLFVFGKTYALVAHPEPSWLATHRIWQGWAAMLAGLLLTACLTGFVAFLANRHSHLERQVQIRTTELLQSETRLRVILEAVQAGILIVDAESHRIVDLNPAAEQMLGVERSEIAGHMCREFGCPAANGECASCWQSQGTSTSERILVGPGGVRIPILRTVVPVTLNGRKHILESFLDITDRKRAEERLAALNEAFLSFGSDVDGNINRLTSLCGQFLDADWAVYSRLENDMLSALGQWNTPRDLNPFDTAEGRICSDIMNSDQDGVIVMSDLAQGAYAQCDPRIVAFGLQTWLGVPVRRGGVAVGALSAVYRRDFQPIENERQFMSIIASAIGIEEGRKHMVDEQRRIQAHLLNSQKMESMGILAGGIAHEFNNILMGILGNVSLALMDLKENSPVRAAIQEIEKLAYRAANLSSQMLASSGKGKFVLTTIDLSALIEGMTPILRISGSRNDVLRIESDDVPPLVRADSSQIRQLVQALVMNASEAIGGKSGTITIRTGTCHATADYLAQTFLEEESMPTGDYAYLEVSDTGDGMDEETMSRVFEPFFSTKFTGRGLGLAAALGIVRGHQGSIKVKSQSGAGTTFRVLFPRAEQPERLQPEKAPPASISFSNASILVVDDEEVVRNVAVSVLERNGFRVLTAVDGVDAVRVFSAHPDEIGVVILDMTMPHMNGDEACRQIQAIRPGTRVILSSGYSQKEATESFSGLGLRGFLQKPYPASDLIAKVREALIA